MPQPNPIHLEAIRPDTASLFSLLAQFPQLKGFHLVGGTAIALIIGHRLSNDLDFAFLGDKLPIHQIDDLVAELKAGGLPVQLITDPSQISNFKIATGNRLLDFARDYMFGDTKVTFFAMGSKHTPGFIEFLNESQPLHLPQVSFSVPSLNSLRTTKAVVLGQRVRSRDLYDLYILVKDHGYTTEQLLHDAITYGTNNDVEYHKAVLRGEIPLDADDEGLDQVGVKTALHKIYGFFDKEISRIEVEQAALIARGLMARDKAREADHYIAADEVLADLGKTLQVAKAKRTSAK